MAVYLFTFHAYRSWGPEHRRGFVRRGMGVLPTDTALGELYQRRAKQERVLFTPEMQDVLVRGAYDICNRRRWRLHGAASEITHVHLLLSWHGFVPTEAVVTKLKSLLGMFLARSSGRQGVQWFSVGYSQKRVEERSHFDRLMRSYLLRHRGVKWFEGEALPMIPAHVLEPGTSAPG